MFTEVKKSVSSNQKSNQKKASGKKTNEGTNFYITIFIAVIIVSFSDDMLCFYVILTKSLKRKNAVKVCEVIPYESYISFLHVTHETTNSHYYKQPIMMTTSPSNI